MAINMRSSYIYALLLIFLLLGDKSQTVSCRISPSYYFLSYLRKEVYKQGRDEAIKYAWDKTLGQISTSDQQANASPMKYIPGLYLVKDYLSQFGYLQYSGGTFSNYSDQDTISAIRAYQQFFKLQITGDLNTQTIQQMKLPRCGVPDMNFEYDLTTIYVSWPKGKPQWFPVGRKYLTYGFLRKSQIPDNAKQVFREAFTQWSQTTRLVNFMESYNDGADIMIGFYDFGEVDDDAMIGGTIILRLQSGVKTAEIRLDGSNKYWVLPTDYKYTTPSFEQGTFDLRTTVIHQIGHVLGLSHSNNKESVMYPAILPLQQRKEQITPSDILTLKNLYANGNSPNSGRFALFGSSSGLVITTFSLGFACLALLH